MNDSENMLVREISSIFNGNISAAALSVTATYFVKQFIQIISKLLKIIFLSARSYFRLITSKLPKYHQKTSSKAR